jgi:hypothetical protein
MFRSHLASSLRRRGLARRELGDLSGSAADAGMAISLWNALPSRDGEECFETACAHAALASLPKPDGSGAPDAERSAEADRAVPMLRKAVEMGYRSRDLYRAEDALDSLRNRKDFKLLMMDLSFPTDAFARAE